MPTVVPPGARALAPDDPRWVEARCLLRTGRGRIVAEDIARGACAVLDRDGREGVIVGLPAEPVLARARACGTRETTWWWPDLAEAPASAVETAGVRAAATPVDLFAPPRLASRPVRAPSSADVRWLMSAATTDLSMVPAEARAELDRAFEAAPVAAAFEDDLAVSFCHASYETEWLWRLSAFTVPRARRRGHARAVSAFVIEHYAAQGKWPVMPVPEGDLSARRLAVALGLAPTRRTTMIRGAE